MANIMSEIALKKAQLEEAGFTPKYIILSFRGKHEIMKEFLAASQVIVSQKTELISVLGLTVISENIIDKFSIGI